MSRKAMLLVIVVTLVAAGQLLGYVNGDDNIGTPSDSAPLWWVLGYGVPVFLFVRGWRGSVTSFEILAAISITVGLFSVAAAFWVPHGPFTLAVAGLIQVALAVAYWLLRWEIIDAKDGEQTRLSPKRRLDLA